MIFNETTELYSTTLSSTQGRLSMYITLNKSHNEKLKRTNEAHYTKKIESDIHLT